MLSGCQGEESNLKQVGKGFFKEIMVLFPKHIVLIVS